MLKKVMALVTILVLVLATAQLALAQQYPTQTPVQQTPQQQDTASGAQPTGAGQTTPVDPAAGQNPGQNQPATGSQTPPSPAAGLMLLDQNNQLVIDCPAVSNALAQPRLTQTEQVELQELSQLCADGGFVAANRGGGNQPSPNRTDATQPQPQQSQGASMPLGGGENNGASPTDTAFNPPPQQSVAVR